MTELKLDYTLEYDYQRVELVQNMSLEKLSPYELEKVTNYILYGRQPTPTKDDKNLPLDEAINHSTPMFTRYTTPRIPIPWDNAKLSQLRDSRDRILAQIRRKPLSIPVAAQMRRWAREIAQTAWYTLYSNNPPITPKPKFPELDPIEIDDYIDYTNSFHIKHLILHYSALRKSPHSKFNMDYLDEIIEFACDSGKILPWQKHMLIRRIDRTHGITIGRELAEDYNKVITPSYVSTAMRAIYKTIANAAKQLQIQHADKHKSYKWKQCPMCQRTLHNSKYFWHSKKKHCIQCEKKKTEERKKQRKAG